MRGQPGFFDIDGRPKRLSDLGDQLETFWTAVDFEVFRPVADRTEGVVNRNSILTRGHAVIW
jgi:hypothetical protein